RSLSAFDQDASVQIHCDRCAQFGHGCTTLAGAAICMQCATDGTLCSFRTNIEQLRTARRWSNFTSTQRLQIRNWIQQTINDELVPPAPELPRSAVVEDNPEVDQLGEETETEVTEDEETLQSNSEDDLDLLSDPQDNREIGGDKAIGGDADEDAEEDEIVEETHSQVSAASTCTNGNSHA
ncbi:hypothetical protein H4Q26_005169, partial [Puccinia striiformis f. sp. tritici PST-130]